MSGVKESNGRAVVLRKGDTITFNLAQWLGGSSENSTGENDADNSAHHAVGITLVASNKLASQDATPKKKSAGLVDDQVHSALVESVKGDYGFISFKAKGSNADSLFFHREAVIGATVLDTVIDPGDEVRGAPDLGCVLCSVLCALCSVLCALCSVLWVYLLLYKPSLRTKEVAVTMAKVIATSLFLFSYATVARSF